MYGVGTTDSNLIYEVNDKGERVVVKSLVSSRRAFIRFTNRSSRPVAVWWRDFQGRKQHYINLDPTDFFDINTFVTHPWEFSDAATTDVFVINNKEIFRPPPIVGQVLFRTNWNITVPVRQLRRVAMLCVAVRLRNVEAVDALGLPRVLAQELREMVAKIRRELTSARIP
ncbi:von Hippel-Lindau-like protein [Bombyx mandarina]|uniref:von Hippel-Lindau disease tumour suppressor beta domain-containing protein n=2 Tax=Bombyx TaxID=7090 RepID=A0A8R2AH22_BOMMO|nr:von Hippel-Lindau-like protein [Bombyx mori]XP_028038842.1 von Hippel-Lindau-like protein [Bombyx mandarina]